MKIRIVNQPTGLLNGKPWPEPNDIMEVPDVVGSDLCASGAAEAVSLRGDKESRPAPDNGVETRSTRSRAKKRV